MTGDGAAFPGIDGVSWPASPTGVLDAWRQLHYASQAVSEVGKSWHEPAADDSHSALTWHDGALRGVGIGDGVHASLRFNPFELRIGDRSLPLAGRTLDESMAWIRKAAGELAGPAMQDAVPAPDLPDHEIARGAAFDGGDPAAFGVVQGLYRAMAETLSLMSDQLPDRPGTLCWPHHFDIAALHVVKRDAGGAMMSTIGVGLAVPDDVEPSGYVYVSGWSRDGLIDTGSLPDSVRWRGSMGVLPLSELGDGGPVVAGFIRTAFGSLRNALER